MAAFYSKPPSDRVISCLLGVPTVCISRAGDPTWTEKVRQYVIDAIKAHEGLRKTTIFQGGETMRKKREEKLSPQTQSSNGSTVPEHLREYVGSGKRVKIEQRTNGFSVQSGPHGPNAEGRCGAKTGRGLGFGLR